MGPARMPGRHSAENGVVTCPAREIDVAVEVCMRCLSLRAITEDRTWVLCDGAPPRPAQAARGAERPV